MDLSRLRNGEGVRIELWTESGGADRFVSRTDGGGHAFLAAEGGGADLAREASSFVGADVEAEAA